MEPNARNLSERPVIAERHLRRVRDRKGYCGLIYNDPRICAKAHFGVTIMEAPYRAQLCRSVVHGVIWQAKEAPR